jgi:hypothetical protein
MNNKVLKDPNDLSIEEKQQLLNRESARYIKGEINRSDLRKAQSKYGFNYGESTLKLSGVFHQLSLHLSSVWMIMLHSISRKQ